LGAQHLQSLGAFSAGGAFPLVVAIAISLLGRGGATRAQCFPLEPVSGFSQEPIGREVRGAARRDGARIELCSSSLGYGTTIDSLFGLVQDTADELELAVDVIGVDRLGQAGVEACVFRATGSDPSQAVVRLAVQEDRRGIGFSVSSGLRPRRSATMESAGAVPVPVQLPVRIEVERRGDEITAFYFAGGALVDHLSVVAEPDSSLDAATYRVGLVHGAGDAEQRAPRTGTGSFGDRRLES
jgi:hypothetical protein